MHKPSPPSRGYSRMEIAFYTVLIALVGLLAVTKYMEMSVEVKEAMEPGVIEGVRQGLSAYAEEARSRGASTLFPAALDNAELGEAKAGNRFFGNVLEKSIAVKDWSKIGPNEYRTPSGRQVVYYPQSGQFLLREETKSLPKGER